MQVTVEEINSTVNNRLNRILFTNAQTGWIVGGDQFLKPTLLKTTNGGISWKEVKLPTQCEQKEIYSINVSQHGILMTCGYGGTLFISNDSGETFNYFQHPSWSSLRSLAFFKNDSVCICGGVGFNQGLISIGSSLQPAYIPSGQAYSIEWSDVAIPDSTCAYVAGYGGILKSTDAGDSWEFTDAKNDFFTSMCWINATTGVAVGSEGSIIRTTDGGDHWTVIRNGNDFTKRKLHFLRVARNQSGTMVAVGEKGCVMISLNNGSSWDLVKSFTQTDLRGVGFSNDASCYVCGDGGHLFKIHL